MVTSVTNFGLFVQIEDLLIDGLVHVTSLKRDYWQFDPAHHRLVGERTGQVYRLGDRVEVKVVRVDMEQRKIDFDLIDTEEAHFIDEDERAGMTSKRGAKRKDGESKKGKSSRKSTDKKGKSKSGGRRRRKKAE